MRVPDAVSVPVRFLLGLTLGVAAAGGAGPHGAAASSCFAVAQTVTCIDAAYVPMVPMVPTAMIPATAGDNIEGADEDVVYRDNGGYEVVRD
jgi:hypothetical protein